MKRILSLILACGLAGLAGQSCMEDKGNYVYQDADVVLPIVISGLRDTTVIVNNMLRIEPQVDNDGEGYVYNWNVTPVESKGYIPKKTVLSEDRILNVPIQLEPRKYNLNFEVKNAALDIYVRKEVELTVTGTDITTGWYVLKEVDGETDFDYINAEGKLYPDVMVNKLLLGGERMKGTPVQILYQQGFYFQQITNPDGSIGYLANQQALHILTSEDIKTFDANTLLLFKNFDQMFYGVPEKCAPQSMTYLDYFGEMYLINDGQLYAMTAEENSGIFTAPKVGYNNLHSDAIAPRYMNALVFDKETSSFLAAEAYYSYLSPLSDYGSYDIDVSPGNMPYDLVEMMTRQETTFAETAYALMKAKDRDKYYLAGIRFDGNDPWTNPFTSFEEIADGSRMPLAAVKAAPYSGSFVYFGDGNKLCAYWDADVPEREVTLKTFPAGETISYIYNRYTSQNNYLVVTTNSATGWKMYVYTIIGSANPEIGDDPEFTYSGTGSARYVIYR